MIGMTKRTFRKSDTTSGFKLVEPADGNVNHTRATKRIENVAIVARLPFTSTGEPRKSNNLKIGSNI